MKVTLIKDVNLNIIQRNDIEPFVYDEQIVSFPFLKGTIFEGQWKEDNFHIILDDGFILIPSELVMEINND